MKTAVKGYVAGILTMLLLFSATMVVASTQTVTREVTYGVNVMLNGEIVRFDYDSRPFVMGGRTFLPLRTIADLLSLPVDFDPATNTALVGSITPIPVLPGTSVGELFFDGQSIRTVGRHRAPRVRVENDTVVMGGVTHPNSVIFEADYHQPLDEGATYQQFASLNLNRRYSRLTGQIGRVDGSNPISASVRIYGDNRLLQEFELGSTDFPVPVSLFVEDIGMIRVEIVHSVDWRFGRSGIVAYAFVGFAE